MNSRITTALLSACIISGTCTYVLHRATADLQGRRGGSSLRYLIATRQIMAGEVLQATDVEAKPWPLSNPIKHAAALRDEVIGRVAIYPIDEGAPVLSTNLASAGSGIGLASRIPSGMRAIALRSDEVIGVAGFLVPDSHVDVLVSYRPELNHGASTVTVVQDARVLAAGQQMQPDPSGKALTATVVTLLLTPAQAQEAVLASTQGVIHFVLRNCLDRTVLNSTPASTDSFILGSMQTHNPHFSGRSRTASIQTRTTQTTKNDLPVTIYGGGI